MHFIGDTHGLYTFQQVIIKKGLENCNVIQVGDLGLGFSDIGRDILDLLNLDDFLLDRNIQLYAIRGNHDCPIFWDKSKGLNLPKFQNINLVQDFEILRLEDKNILFAGGAISIDRIPRKHDKPYPTWWKDEEFKYKRLLLEKNLKYANGPIDIVVTHNAPSFCHPTDDDVEIVNYYHTLEAQMGNNLKEELRLERAEITEFYDDLTKHYGKKPSHWFYGHFHAHKNKEIGRAHV